MANVIEIVIHATDAATAQIRGVQTAVGGMQASMSGLLAVVGGPAGIALALGAVGAAGMKMAGDFADSVERLDNLSKVTGFAVNDLRVLQRAMVEAGKSPETLDTALFMLKRNLEANSKALRAIVGDTDDPMEALLRLSAAAAGGQGSAAVSMAAFGRAGKDLAPILGDLGSRVKDLQGRMVQLGPDALQAARDFDKAMDEMKTAAGELGAVVAPFFAKTMVGAIGILIASFKALRGEGIKALSELARAIASMTGTVIPGPAGAGGGGGVGGGPDPFAMMRQNFGDTGAGDVGQRGTAAATQEQWQKLVATWNEAEPVAKKLAVALEEIDLGLQALEFGVESLAFGFLDFFDGIVFRGQNAADALREMFTSTIRDIANQLLKIGIGLALDFFSGGATTGFKGALGLAGRGMAGIKSQGLSRGGDTYIINTLDSQTLRTSLQPGGTFNRAQDQVRIGSRY